MRPKTLQLQAGVPIQLAMGGTFFLIDTAAFPVAVEFFGAGNIKRDEELEGGQAGDYVTPENGFASFRITSALAQSVKVYVGRGRVGRFRLYGEVSVIDGGKARSIANSAFLGVCGLTAAAAQYPHCQLFNPAASGKRVIVSQVIFSSGSGQQVQAVFYNTACATAVRAITSKLNGGAAGAGLLRTESNAVQLGGTDTHWDLIATANTPFLVPLREPIVLGEGQGIVVRGLTPQTALTAVFECTEEDSA